MVTMLLSRRAGLMARLFCKSSPSHDSIVPRPSVACRHCSRAVAFSDNRSSLATRWATRSLLMMSSCVDMLLGRNMAEIGSGARTSTTKLAFAVYCRGSCRITGIATSGTNTATTSAMRHRARRISRICFGFMRA